MRLGFWLGLAAAVGSLLLPLLLYDAELTIYVFIGLSIIVVAGLNLLYGFAGQVSLGQGAFYAIGAYCAGILARRGIPPLAALLLAPVLTAAVAVVVGLPVLRLRGHYLAFATLAFQLIVLSIASRSGVKVARRVIRWSTPVAPGSGLCQRLPSGRGFQASQ